MNKLVCEEGGRESRQTLELHLQGIKLNLFDLHQMIDLDKSRMLELLCFHHKEDDISVLFLSPPNFGDK